MGLIISGRRIEMMISDMDGTLINPPAPPFFSSWDHLSFALPKEKRKEWERIRDFYAQRPELYSFWFEEQVKLLEGLLVEDAKKVLFPIQYTPGAELFFKRLDGRCIKGIVSSGINIVAEKIFAELNFDFYFSNELGIKDGFFDGSGKEIVKIDKKEEAVRKAMENYGISQSGACYIGDNFNDIPVRNAVGLLIALGKKCRELTYLADIVVEDFDELSDLVFRAYSKHSENENERVF